MKKGDIIFLVVIGLIILASIAVLVTSSLHRHDRSLPASTPIVEEEEEDLSTLVADGDTLVFMLEA